jgi:hypothetical protein
MIVRRSIKRRRYAQYAFSAEAIQAFKDLMAIGDGCACVPKPQVPPWTGSHPDPSDPRYYPFYSAPPPRCPTCVARQRAKTQVHLLAGIRPWERDPSPKLAALAIAAGFEPDDDEED